MNLQNAPAKYDPIDQSTARHAIERADRINYKRNTDLIVPFGFRLMIYDDDGVLWEIRVSTAGVLSAYSHPDPVALSGHGMTASGGTLTP